VSAREFEYVDGKSSKFWKVEVQGTSVVTRYGRIGTDGQETKKEFGSAAEAQKAHDKLVAEKVGKGYVEKTKGGGSAAKTTPKSAAKSESAADSGGKKPATAKASKASGAGAKAAGKREFQFISGSSSKFWAIELKGSSFDVTFGRLGTAGTTQTKSFPSAEAAQKNYEKLIEEKTAKGYVEAGSGGGGASKPGASEEASSGGVLSPMMFYTTRDGDFSLVSNFIGQRVTDFRPGKPVQGKSVFRIRVSYDEEGEEDGEANFGDRLQAFFASPAAAETKGLIFGAYDLEGGSTGKLNVDALVKAKDKLPNLVALFVGDIMQEECEISWINQSDISPVLAAFPNLEMLRIRGATDLQISKPQHNRLRALAIESGGLSPAVVAQICRGKFPELEYLELWLGTPDYGGDCRVNDLQPILTGKLFPNLRYLGLRNAEIADDIAAVIVKSPVVDRLETLDLSLGNLSDEGANALLGLADKGNLKRLDLHHHYISKPLQKKLKALPFPVDLADAKTVEEDDEFGGRFISVSE
jgi:predicted DNA-binding WGR domain protein